MKRHYVLVAVAIFALTGIACRGESIADAATIDQNELDSMVVALMPTMEKATGLKFKEQPKAAVRSTDQVRAYLLAQLESKLPPERLEGIKAAYSLLGMIPDTLDLTSLFVDLYTEQVAGFYDPDSTTLYAVSGTSRDKLSLTIMHELVHVLQHQYTPLDSILNIEDDADRLAAAQAVFEGQATIAQLIALAPQASLLADDSQWQMVIDQFNTTRPEMGVMNSAPLVIRSGLLFPYRDGATFMRWFMRFHQGEQPFGQKMPLSTEQILHPDKYEAHDQPVRLRFTSNDTTVISEDTFGEFEIDIMRSSLAGIGAVPTDPALGWGGDRYRVYRTAKGPALVWYSVWDADYLADRFIDRIGSGIGALHRDGYRTDVDRMPVGPRAGARVVVAPIGWSGWGSLPSVAESP